MFSLNKIKILLKRITKNIGNYVIKVLKCLKKSNQTNNNFSQGYMDTISENQLEALKLFRSFDDVVRKFYEKEELKALEQLDYNSKNSAIFFSEIVGSKEPLHDFEYSHFKVLDELQFISKDIKYLTALTYFFRPYINNPVKDGSYFQTVEDRRYMIFCSLCLQAVYNFWDRIGDLLWRFFETGLDERKVYLSSVLNNFPSNFKGNPNFIELKTIYEDEVKPLFDLRNEVVHYYQLECKMYWGAIEFRRNNQKLQKLQQEKESYPEYYKKQLHLTNHGFKVALNLINELPDRTP